MTRLRLLPAMLLALCVSGALTLAARAAEVTYVLAIANGRVYIPTSDEIFCIGLKDAKPAAEPKIVLDDGKAEVICNFCRARYDFDDAELERIRRRAAGGGGPPS